MDMSSRTFSFLYILHHDPKHLPCYAFLSSFSGRTIFKKLSLLSYFSLETYGPKILLPTFSQSRAGTLTGPRFLLKLILDSFVDRRILNVFNGFPKHDNRFR